VLLWLAPAAGYYALLLTAGGFSLTAPMPNGLTFNSMLLHLLDGLFDVDPAAIGGKAFGTTAQSTPNSAFSPALVSAPFLWLAHFATTDFTRLACLAGVSLMALFKLLSARLAWRHAGEQVIFDGNAVTAAINQRFAAGLALPLGLHPWIYPPPFLMLFLRFGALPPVASAVSFLLAGRAASLAVVWRYGTSESRRWPMIGTLLLCPAVLFNVLTGQNAFYTAALPIGGFGSWRATRFSAAGCSECSASAAALSNGSPA
jgi:hypothetical protein